MVKKILYIDMDNVLVDFQSGIDLLDPKIVAKYQGNLDEVPGIFGLMSPMEQALESYEKLSDWYNTFILSTAPWNNPSAWVDKLHWVKKHLGEPVRKRLILTHNKHLNYGDFLIDDRPNNGAIDFNGEWIHFGGQDFPDWNSVVDYLHDRR